MITLDTETCGLHGLPVLIQYKIDDGPIQLFDIWTHPVRETMSLIEMFCQHTVMGFNLAFDWFHICKIYTTFESFLKNYPHLENELPEDYIEEMALCEKDARDGSCVKPKSAIDVMLHAKKTKYQVTMERSDIRVKRVPTVLAWNLAAELEKRILFDPILFAKRSDKYSPKWKVYDVKQKDGRVSPDFKDIVLKFKASATLKALAIDALKLDPTDVLLFDDIAVHKSYNPQELAYAPYALAVGDQKDWKGAWPAVIDKHINHWEFNQRARLYAGKDVEYTYRLWEFFGKPEAGDDSSVLACMVAAVRWRGYSVDIDGLKQLRREARKKIKTTPTAPGPVKRWIAQSITDVLEKDQFLSGPTKKTVLEGIASSKLYAGTETQARAKAVLDARFAKNEIGIYDKLIASERLHASFKVTGALSDRMSGDGKLNPQGIKHTKEVRKNFTFAHGQLVGHGGDFDGFEVTIAEEIYKDDGLHKALTTKNICPDCKGTGKKKGNTCDDCRGEGQANQKVHGLFAMSLFPGKTYKEVVESKGSDLDMYDYGKRGVFALMYGGNWSTLVSKLKIDEEDAKAAEQLFFKTYPGVFRARLLIIEKFCSMTQPGGIGTQVVWKDPADYIESLFGFRRYFTLENMVCKVLFQLANNVPKEWKSAKIRVKRRDREQTAFGAVQSALYAAAFNIQSANTRAAANHEIQSSGAQITKRVQRRIWDQVPVGVAPWEAQPCNVHDEILCPILPSRADHYKAIIDETVESFRPKVPLISMEWKPMNNWAEK